MHFSWSRCSCSGQGWPSFAWEKSKYMASFALFWSPLLSSPDLFRLNTFEHYKNIKRAYLLRVNIFMKSNYGRELKESRVETQELSHILQFALLASLAKAKASPGPKTFPRCHDPAVVPWLREGVAGYCPACVLHLFSHKLRGGEVRRYSLSLSSIQRDIRRWLDTLASSNPRSRSPRFLWGWFYTPQKLVTKRRTHCSEWILYLGSERDFSFLCSVTFSVVQCCFKAWEAV